VVVGRTKCSQSIAVSATSQMLRADIVDMMYQQVRRLGRCLVDTAGKHQLVNWKLPVTSKVAAELDRYLDK
jgi:hypothetical protein